MRPLPLTVLFLLSACKVFDPSLVEEPDAGANVPDVPEDLPDATVDVFDSGGPPVENGCEGEGMVFPQRPMIPDTTGDEQVIGLHELTLRQDGGRWRTIGRNLDGLCSLPPVPLVECQPRNEDSLPQIDGEGGIDNAFGGAFFDLLNATAPELDETARRASTQGIGALVLRIRGYNGEADDPRVEVAVLQSVYAFSGTAGETEAPAHEVVEQSAFELDGTTPKAFPTWDGNDWLFLREENFYDADLETPVVVSNDAYVSGGVLVVTLEDNVPFNFASSAIGISVKLTDARLVVGIREDSAMTGRAQLSGRWKVQEMLQSARTLGICPGSPQFDILARRIDTLADVLSRAGDDNSIPCDAMSAGVEWEISPARVGGLALGAQPPDLCDAEE
ncbi:MAG: hypothetical protein ACI9KE_004901 [Polyangiales bacterium]